MSSSMEYGQGETDGDNATFMLASGDEAGYVLVWNRGQNSIHVPLDSQTNLPTIGGYSSFNSFQAFANAFVCLPTVLPDGDDQDLPTTMHMDDNLEQQHPTTFELPPNTSKAPTNLGEPLTPRDDALFLSWHIKLGHLPFNMLCWVAQLGIVPKQLAKCRNQVCPACLYEK